MLDAISSMADPAGTIQNLASTMAAQKTGSEVGTAMLSKALDIQETMGDSMVRMMENSVNPAVGGNFDVSV